MTTWTFLTNHAHVLVCIAREPEVRLRTIAAHVGVTERAAHRLVSDLVAEGYVSRKRAGRNTVYTVHPDAPLRHPLEQHRDVGALLTSVDAGQASPPFTDRSASPSYG